VRILFATDGSPEADLARDLLSRLPFVSGSELLVASVVGREETDDDESHDQPNNVSTDEIREAREEVERSAYQLAKAGVATECLVVGGYPADVICRIAEEKDIDLVVLGSSGRSALARFFLGSVSQRAAKHASCPVLIVKPPAEPIQEVLVGVDGSEDSKLAVEFLHKFPLPQPTQVTLVHVVHVPSPAFGDARGYYETAELGGELERLRAAAEGEGQKVLEEASESLRGAFKVESLLTAGPPARRLIELAGDRDASLVVVGCRGLTGVERFLMGSVSLQVCHHAPCSVMVVRERAK
jgi:nucleotide-binding universal stress UspA family protein